MSVDGIGNFPSFGVGSVGSTRAANERRNRRDAESAAADPRAAFDAELQAMLGDAASISEAGRAQTAQSAQAGQTPQQIRPPQTDTGTDADTYSPSRTAPATYNAAGRLNRSSAAPVAAPVNGSGTLASQPATVPAGAESTGSTENTEESRAEGDSKGAPKVAGELSKAEEEQVSKLQQRDAEVRAHEQAHQATGGEHAGGASYTYQRGPDNRQYAVGGSVPIDVSPVADDPEATVQKAEKVRAAAMAPASPSGQDQAVAAKASQMAAKARVEQAEQGLNPDKDDKDGLAAAGNKKSDKATDKAAGDATATDKAAGDSSATDKAAGDATADDKAVSGAEQAAVSGLTSLSAEAVTEARTPEQAADKAREASKLGVGGAASPQTAAASGGQARPSESISAMDPARSTDSSREAQFSPAAQATRAAFTAMNSLNSLQQSAGTADASQTRPADAPSVRAMNRAATAYARTRGETGLAPSGTGISMAV